MWLQIYHTFEKIHHEQMGTLLDKMVVIWGAMDEHHTFGNPTNSYAALESLLVVFVEMDCDISRYVEG
jgi:hypothetical protein